MLLFKVEEGCLVNTTPVCTGFLMVVLAEGLCEVLFFFTFMYLTLRVWVMVGVIVVVLERVARAEA